MSTFANAPGAGPTADGRPRSAPRFVSTRGAGPVVFGDALMKGLAPDGGLFVPEHVPHLPARGPVPGSFTESALWAARALLAGSMPEDGLAAVVGSALDFEVPLVEVEDGLHVMELFHGPSLAFKDVGARFMARAMAALDEVGSAGDGGEADGPRPTGAGAGPSVGAAGSRTVLVATSGDTGGAVASAFHGLVGARVVVLFPRDGISARQRRQMTTLGGNVTAVAVRGTFDDCQRMAKAAFRDEGLGAACRLTSANSINVGRLIPQTFYYVHAAALLGWHGASPTFVVPSGNLGNLCAGLLAHRAGLPAAGFVAATNANRVFPDYLGSGRFQARASTPTVSNAMDVGDPSNLERIRWLYGDDVESLRRHVTGVASDDRETRAAIADVFRRTGYLLDPHTAVAYACATKAGLPRQGPTVVLATAHPAKFPETVEDATGQAVPLPSTLADRMDGREHWMEMEPSDSDLRRLLLNEDVS